jgi:hypothetical protein
MYFGIVIYYDLRTQKIFNTLIFIGLIFGLIYGFWLNGIESTILGGMIGFSLMYVVYVIGNTMMPYIAKKRGIYLQNKALYRNDVLFGLISGLILGKELITSGLFFSLLFFCIVSILYLIYKIIKHEYHPGLSLPASPFIILGSLFVVYYPVLIELTG